MKVRHRNDVPRTSAQGGAALLVLLAFLLMASAAALVERMHSASRNRVDDIATTARVLAEAKAALIGYAVSYPEHHGGGAPGLLPCPDTDNDGSPNTPCASNAIGRLPWNNSGTPAARLPELRDAASAHLWYAVADNFRNNPSIGVLNSETPGQLSLDGSADIVAVVIAPGAPLQGQDRQTGPNAVANYLEGDNASAGDASFTARGGTPGVTYNDTVAVITRGELMTAVERRVMGDLAQAMERYRVAAAADYPADANWNDDGVYPWLSAFADPATSPFKSSVGTRRGHVALHWTGEIFTTEMKADWDVQQAITNRTGSVSNDDVEKGDFTVSDAACVWLGAAQQFDCTAVRTRNDDCLGDPGISIQRTYRFQYSGDYDIKRPKNDRLRQRKAKVDADPFPTGTVLAVGMVDVALSGPNAGAQCGSGALISDGDTKGKFKLEKIRWDLGVPEELPQWFYDNDWHHLLYVAEAQGYSPAGSGSCAAGSNCLVLAGMSPSNDKHAVIVAAGSALAGQARTGSVVAADYFELDNADGDDGFTRVDATPAQRRAPFSTVLNDQVRAVAP